MCDSIFKDKIEKISAIALNKEVKIDKVVKLHGDASNRIYFRAYLKDGHTIIVMQLPEGKASLSEEITNYSGDLKDLAFINVARFLGKAGVRVPKISHYSAEDHLMLLEDLGDDLMSKQFEHGDGDTKKKLYEQAIDLLVFLQQSTAKIDGDCVALKRSFDERLLNWEFDHFLEYGINARLNIEMKKEAVEQFNFFTRKISANIIKFPYGFTHRDFQSRNILILNNEFVLIDFQDALMGPRVYDLVSLLRDSYISLDAGFVDDLIKQYCDSSKIDFNICRQQFDVVTCQRKLKDAGRFVYIDKVKGNPSYLKYIPQTLGYVKDALKRLPQYAEFYKLLAKYVPEWNGGL
ncbi:MAG: aminoglycoside phosphotransferase [Deltaproteobacteria bacterium CG07_land_8_20_14_0_80_38_7]|nr:MAG: aminoglycoside phosphotransferase [Deltaproteobacteria bacterium CG07_land_8_20_14_0_80_38_7]